MTMPISLPDAAKLRGVHPATLRRAVRRNRLKAQKVGTAYATTMQDVDEYLVKYPPKVGRPKEKA